MLPTMDNLQVNQQSKGSSRSQSPSNAEMTRSNPSATDDSVIRSRVQSPSNIHQDSSASQRSHGKWSLRDGVSLTPSGGGQLAAVRSSEESPQKQILTAADLSAFSPNLSYALSDDYVSPPHYRGLTLDSDYGTPIQDESDGAGGTTSRAATAITHLNSKIARTKDLIRLEQTIRDENVNEYLKLAASADKQQLSRIKAVFEKKNQKSAHSISQLQKKLEGYHKRIKNWEEYGTSAGQGSHRPPREVLRDMGQGLKNVGGNIRDGITGLGGSVLAAPRELAHLFTRGNRYGSADNIAQLAAAPQHTELRANASSEGSRTADGNAGCGSDGGGRGSTLPRAGEAPANRTRHFTSDDGSECSSVTSESMPGCGYQNAEGSNNISDTAYSLKPILSELRERREEFERLNEQIDTFKNVAQEVSFISSALQEERYRCERLEEQINDLTELHQNEVENLKQALADVEEKVQYQSEERIRDIHEALDLCQTKMSKIEHVCAQQAAALSGGGAFGGGDGARLYPPPRLLLVKLINVALTLLQLLLLLVATAAGIAMPFLRTRVRILTTLLAVVMAMVVLKQWPEVTELWEHAIVRLKKSVIDKDFNR